MKLRCWYQMLIIQCTSLFQTLHCDFVFCGSREVQSRTFYLTSIVLFKTFNTIRTGVQYPRNIDALDSDPIIFFFGFFSTQLSLLTVENHRTINVSDSFLHIPSWKWNEKSNYLKGNASKHTIACRYVPLCLNELPDWNNYLFTLYSVRSIGKMILSAGKIFIYSNVCDGLNWIISALVALIRSSYGYVFCKRYEMSRHQCCAKTCSLQASQQSIQFPWLVIVSHALSTHKSHGSAYIVSQQLAFQFRTIERTWSGIDHNPWTINLNDSMNHNILVV